MGTDTKAGLAVAEEERRFPRSSLGFGLIGQEVEGGIVKKSSLPRNSRQWGERSTALAVPVCMYLWSILSCWSSGVRRFVYLDSDSGLLIERPFRGDAMLKREFVGGLRGGV